MTPSLFNRLRWYCMPVALVLGLVIGPMLRHGMFIDGLVYTNIAKNLANSIGTLWQPRVFPEGFVFYEHPGLLPWLESWFFSLLGDGPHTEDWYNFAVLGLTVVVLYLIWIKLVSKSQRWLFFFPLLLWVLSQEVQLRYPNTMLECGLTLVLLATTLGYLHTERRWPLLSYITVGLGVFLAVLSKGPFGLFLLALPFLHRLIISSKVVYSALFIPLLMVITCFAVLFSVVPAALHFFTQYLDQQVLAAIAGERTENIANTRFDFIYWLVLLNLPAIILSGLLAVAFRKTAPRLGVQRKRSGWLFLLLGGLAIFPLVISIKQAAYYQLPALPFFAVSAGLLLLPRLERVIQWVEERKLVSHTLTGVAFSALLMTSIIAFGMLGTTDRRDREVLQMAEEVAIVMDSLGKKEYELRLLGNIASAAQRSYRLTNFLARHQEVYLKQQGKTDIQLIIRHGGNPLPQESRVVFRKDDVYLVER